MNSPTDQAAIIPGTAKQLRYSFPKKWMGPSLAVWVKASSDSRLFVSGYFERLVEWEGLQDDFALPLFLDSKALHDQPNDQLSSMVTDAQEILIEIDFDDELDQAVTIEHAQTLLGSLSENLKSVSLGQLDLSSDFPDYTYVSATANKLPQLDAHLHDCELLDVSTMSLPNRHGSRSFKFAYCKRPSRILLASEWSVVLWLSPNKDDHLNWGNTPDSAQRWPHHAIPGLLLDKGTRDRIHTDNAQRVLAVNLIERLIVNELYFLRHLQTEIEQLEGQFLQHLRRDHSDAVDAISHATLLDRSLETVANLDSYLQLARETSTRLRRRLDVSTLGSELRRHSDLLNSSLEDGLSRLDDVLKDRRTELRESLQAVNTSTEVAGLREYLSEQQRTERFRTFASGIALAFSVASLTVAVYGSNIRDLTPIEGRSILLLGALSLAVVSIIYMGASLRLQWRRRTLQGTGRARRPR